jgi:YD repeat-containing protein
LLGALTEFGQYGTNTGQFVDTKGIAINSTGSLYIVDEYNARIQVWNPPGAGGANQVYSTQFGSTGTGHGQFELPRGIAVDGHGNIWVSDQYNHRVEEFSPKGEYLAAYGSDGTGNGQFGSPTGLDVNQSTGNVYIADCEDNRIEELSSTGEFIRTFGSAGTEPGKFKCPGGVKIDASGDAWVTDSGNNRIEEFSSTGAFIAAYGSSGSGNDQFDEPWGITIDAGNIYVADDANNRIEELSSSGTYLGQFGMYGDGGGQFKGPEEIAVDPAGNLYVVDNGHSRIEEFTSTGTFLMSFGSEGTGEGQLKYPEGIAINAGGDVYVADTVNNRIEEWTPVNQAVHDTQTIYYTAAANTTYPACGEHAEWASLVCQTQPGGQPEDGTTLPIKTFTYNLWDETETAKEAYGSTIRTSAQTYDPAGRALTSETTSTVDTALPKVTNEYNTTTGALEKQSTTTSGKTKTITSVQNTLGQLVKYTDGAGNTTTYEYELEGDDRLTGINDGKGTQSYTYDPTTGLLTKLVDSAAGTFTAGYDVEGKMLTESYPNGMTATTTINSVGQATGIEYVKTTHCTSSCTWFSDTVLPSIHGETLAQTSTLSGEAYTYDNAGRLTQTEETPAGKGCVTRIYAYDEESNRRSLTTREPGSKGECATEGGTVERHIYDPANRLMDSGTTYETFGNTIALPATDAGGHELTNSYYVDSQVAGQTQNEKTVNYHYDPVGRTEETETIVKGKTESNTIANYAGPGEAVTWTGEGAEKWSRNIPGIDGALDAVQTSSGTTILQLHDLQGNIVGTAALSETETKLLSTFNNTEFGVPTTINPSKYSWLGANGVSTEFATGIATNGGSSYVPEIGRPLQTGPIASPGAFPDGTGGIGIVQATYLQAAATQIIGTILQNEASRNEATKRETEEHTKLTECPASACHVDGPGEGNCEVNCVTVIGGKGAATEPSETEWIAAEEAFDRAEGITGARTASVASEFKNWVKAVAHGASQAGEYLYDHSILYFPEQVKQAKSSWHFFVELFSLGSYTEVGLQCAKGGDEEAFEVGEVEPPPVDELLVPVGAVLGCINGVMGGR